MSGADPALMRVEAELKTSVATVQIAHFRLDRPIDSTRYEDNSFWIDLSLTPRTPNARATFQNRWSPHRFENLGKMFLIPPHEAWRARSDCGHQTSVLCLLSANCIEQWLETELEWTNRRLEASIDLSCDTIQRLLLRLAEEARHPGFASAALSESIALQIAIELCRYYLGIEEENRSGGLPPWRLRLIDERLREMRTPPTLGELAELCGLSVRHLTRSFRASRGCSIGDYIAQSRIENAKRLLCTDESVKSISYSLGFASPSSFCYAFRKATGRTPQQFRRDYSAARIHPMHQ